MTKLRPEIRGARGVREFWKDYRWFIIGGLWLIALLLGYVGFDRYFAALGEERPPWNLLYLSFQLFTFESGAVEERAGLALEIARWLAPATAAYTAFQTLSLIFREQLQIVRLRFFRDHIVICGLGRKGYRLATEFTGSGKQVAVIEMDEDNPFIEVARSAGIVVLLGDATSPQALERARIHSAQHLIAVVGNDSDNAEIAVLGYEMSKGRRDKPLGCTVHLVDPQLCGLLRDREILAGKGGTFRLNLFNVFDSGAQVLLNRYPPSGGADTPEPHILVVGLGQMGQSLIAQAGRLWAQGGQNEQLRVTVVDRDAEQRVASLNIRHPQLARDCQLIPLSMDVGSPEFERAAFLTNEQGQCDITSIYVCLDDEGLALSTALTLHQRLGMCRIPLVVRMEQDGGLAHLLHGLGTGGGSFDNLHTFGLLDRSFTSKQVLNGTHEWLAQALHEEGYLTQTGGTSPSAAVPWVDLDEMDRESCRREADHIAVKLDAVGYAVVSRWNREIQPVTFTEEEIEQMARMEHERWRRERQSQGWTHGPERDDDHKKNPLLVDWEDLSKETQELNKNLVRRLPDLLARAGLELRRVKE